MKKLEKSESKNIKKAAEIIKKGGIVIFPTDTVYGIGAKFDDEKAINRIRKIKKTPIGQMYPVLVSNINQAKSLAKLERQAEKLAKKYWPGQLTIVVKSKSGQKIGLRLPQSDIVNSIIKQSKTPIIGTSANFHGDITPTTYEQLDANFIKLVDFVVKGVCTKKAESTVIDLSSARPKILRQGALKLDEFKN